MVRSPLLSHILAASTSVLQSCAHAAQAHVDFRQAAMPASSFEPFDGKRCNLDNWFSSAEDKVLTERQPNDFGIIHAPYALIDFKVVPNPAGAAFKNSTVQRCRDWKAFRDLFLAAIAACANTNSHVLGRQPVHSQNFSERPPAISSVHFLCGKKGHRSQFCSSIKPSTSAQVSLSAYYSPAEENGKSPS